jgi:hypothetical protein
VGNNQRVPEPLSSFVSVAEAWQRQHGYKNRWGFPRMYEALRKLNSQPIDRILHLVTHYHFDRNERKTPFEKIGHNYKQVETFTPDVIEAMKVALKGMK